jgi:hypothetical protein
LTSITNHDHKRTKKYPKNFPKKYHKREADKKRKTNSYFYSKFLFFPLMKAASRLIGARQLLLCRFGSYPVSVRALGSIGHRNEWFDLARRPHHCFLPSAVFSRNGGDFRGFSGLLSDPYPVNGGKLSRDLVISYAFTTLYAYDQGRRQDFRTMGSTYKYIKFNSLPIYIYSVFFLF